MTRDLTPVELELERYRAELTGYCNRMLGSPSEAEDAVQDTLVRAWRGLGRLERRARLRSWLYSIATNVCRDMLSGGARRASAWPPAGPDRDAEAVAGIGPYAGGIAAPDADPAEIAARRDTVRRAFLAAFQHLPPRQRAALLLCEVLRWRAVEVAELLGTSAAAVRSALQRARATLAAVDAGAAGPARSLRPHERDLMARYVAAFVRDEVGELAALIRQDAMGPAAPEDGPPGRPALALGAAGAG